MELPTQKIIGIILFLIVLFLIIYGVIYSGILPGFGNISNILGEWFGKLFS
ncbi:MAG: hypothetical protein KAT28_01055 [Candidatus Aenigmarchaeota archaeon]|nr:hypothetical protein [Candidatus Aenigmarchaeota archaeon]